jgi:hypothetical protein
VKGLSRLLDKGPREARRIDSQSDGVWRDAERAPEHSLEAFAQIAVALKPNVSAACEIPIFCIGVSRCQDGLCPAQRADC